MKAVKAVEGNWKDGKLNGLVVEWHENGQKLMEANYKDGEVTSGKYWNSEGEPVNSRRVKTITYEPHLIPDHCFPCFCGVWGVV